MFGLLVILVMIALAIWLLSLIKGGQRPGEGDWPW
jgi:hypothetical protein